MNKLRAAIAKFKFVVILLIPFQLLAESDHKHDEEVFEVVCKDYKITGPSAKCESNLHKVEKPLISKHQLNAPYHAIYVFLNSKDANIDQKLCSFELNGEIIFERSCNPKVTIINEDIILIGSGMYFVYARRTNDKVTEFDTNNLWDVYWNGEAYYDHAHTPLGKARLVFSKCLKGDNFRACIE